MIQKLGAICLSACILLSWIPAEGITRQDDIYSCTGIDITEPLQSGSNNTVLATDAENVSEDDLNRIHSSPMKNYFYNLRNKFGYNEFGSCGYVGIGMLLTYYDSYWNDNLVPDNLEAKTDLLTQDQYTYAPSPGSNEFPIGINYTSSDYINILSSFTNISLHANLINIGQSLNYNLGLSLSQIENVLNEYLASNTNIENSEWSIYKVEDMTNTAAKEQIINYINEGIPVLVGIISRLGTSKHIVIAYDYDISTDTIYAHYGWRADSVENADGSTTDYGYYYENMLGLGYPNIGGYIALIPNGAHVHTDNYHIATGTICTCQFPNHQHKFEYTKKNVSQHIKACYCGETSTVSHRFTISGLSYKCIDCGFMKPYDGGMIVRPYHLLNPEGIVYAVEDVMNLGEEII